MTVILIILRKSPEKLSGRISYIILYGYEKKNLFTVRKSCLSKINPKTAIGEVREAKKKNLVPKNSLSRVVNGNNYCTSLLIIVIRFLHLSHFDFTAKKFGGEKKNLFKIFSRTGLAMQKHNSITIILNQKLSTLNNPRKLKDGKLHLKSFL